MTATDRDATTGLLQAVFDVLPAGIVLLDADLLRFATVFPAGGTPHAMFEIATDELVRLSGARVADVRQETR